MGIKNKAQILLFPVTFAAGIVTGIAVMRTKKKAAGIAAVDAALLEELPAEEAEGRVCAEYVYCYPPGIPILVPGERILPEHRSVLARLSCSGCRIHHSFAREGQDIFFVTKRKF